MSAPDGDCAKQRSLQDNRKHKYVVKCGDEQVSCILFPYNISLDNSCSDSTTRTNSDNRRARAYATNNARRVEWVQKLHVQL